MGQFKNSPNNRLPPPLQEPKGTAVKKQTSLSPLFLGEPYPINQHYINFALICPRDWTSANQVAVIDVPGRKLVENFETGLDPDGIPTIHVSKKAARWRLFLFG